MTQRCAKATSDTRFYGYAGRQLDPESGVSYDKPATGQLLSSITDPLGRTLTFSYQADGRASSQTEPGNALRSFRYGTDQDLAATWVTEINGATSEYLFDSSYRLVETIHPDGTRAHLTWTDQNQVAQSTDELGYVTQYGYDIYGNLTSVQKPEDKAQTTIAYNTTFDVPTLITPLAGAPTESQINPTTGDVVG